MKILLIEDNPADARLFTIMMREKEGVHHDITVTQTMRESLAAMNDLGFDAAFVDLNLPDSNGLDTLRQVLGCKLDMPVIVLTGMDDDQMGSEAIHQGAQDYLPKEEASGSVLDRCLRHSIERKKLTLKLQQETRKALEMQAALQDLQEKQELEKLVSSREGLTGKRTTSASLSMTQELVSEYMHILEQTVSEQIYNTDNRHTHLLQKMIIKLGELAASPKDIIQLHLKAIEAIMKGGSQVPEGVYIEEGRILLLQAMGELASYYRRHSLKNKKI